MYPLISGDLASTGGEESIYYNARYELYKPLAAKTNL